MGPTTRLDVREEEENLVPLSVIKPGPLVAVCTAGFCTKTFYVLPRECTYALSYEPYNIKLLPHTTFLPLLHAV